MKKSSARILQTLEYKMPIFEFADSSWIEKKRGSLSTVGGKKAAFLVKIYFELHKVQKMPNYC